MKTANEILLEAREEKLDEAAAKPVGYFSAMIVSKAINALAKRNPNGPAIFLQGWQDNVEPEVEGNGMEKRTDPESLRKLLQLLPKALIPNVRGNPSMGVYPVRFSIGAVNGIVKKLAIAAGLHPHPSVKDVYVDDRHKIKEGTEDLDERVTPPMEARAIQGLGRIDKEILASLNKHFQDASKLGSMVYPDSSTDSSKAVRKVVQEINQALMDARKRVETAVKGLPKIERSPY